MKTLLALCIFFFFLPAPITGQRVYDFADTLSSTNEAELESLIKETESQTTAQITVVVVYSLNGEDVDTYANKLFNSWGIGQKSVNNGVLFLIAPNDRRTRIEVGYGLEPLITDSLAGEILDNEVIPYFKDNNVEGGIVNGTKEIASILKKYPEAARGLAGSAPGFVMTSSRKALVWALGSIAAAIGLFAVSFWFGKKRNYSGSILAVFGILLAGLLFMAWRAYSGLSNSSSGVVPLAGAGITGVLALFQNLRRYRRYRPHFCKECGTQMLLLDETKDDQKLSKEEQLEEQLGSVDYDVWQCPGCSKIETNDYSSIFSSYSKCSKCSRRTYSETTKTVIAATYSSSGSAKVSGTCKSCQYKNEFMRTIPRLTRSSSGSSGRSGGGGFGGGSSGGGGSSRGW